MNTKVLNRLQMQCVRREYCVRDIRAKALKALDGDADAAEEMVSALVADKFVDDCRYATAFARDKASLAGWGTFKIRMALQAKGIASEVIDSALGEVDLPSADARLDKLVATRKKALEGDPQQRLKLLRYLLGRGYDYDTVERAISRCK